MNQADQGQWGANRQALLTLEQAWQCIAQEVRPLAPESATLDQLHGRVLAAPILASEDFPAFDKVMMDGFAVRAEDARVAPVTLAILGLVAAGQAGSFAVTSGGAVRVNTGAPVPLGADCIVRVEDTAMSPDGMSIRLLVAPKAGAHITRRGAHIRRGDLVLAPPLTLEAPQIGVLATNGATGAAVYRRPTVGLIVTGNELVPTGRIRAAGQIFESNGPMLVALMREFGADTENFGIARDDLVDLRERLTAAMKHPIVIAVGGMSMGTLDLVPSAFADLGVTWKFHGVSVRPGKPVAYGRGPDGQHVFGLPGNPISAYVCSWLFVRMALRGLGGHASAPPHRWRATLTRALKPARDRRPAFLPAHVWNDLEDGMMAEPCAWGGSGDPFGAALANALIARDDPAREILPGAPVEVILISAEV